MAMRAKHPCAVPGCPKIVAGSRYCDEHQIKVTAAQDQNRGSSSQRGYGARWRRLRAMYLAANPLCVDPRGVHGKNEVVLATDVDHIIPRSQGGTDEWSNLQALCHDCHSYKTAARDGGFGNHQVTRGREGVVKSLQAFEERPRRQSNSHDRKIRGGGYDR